MDLVTIQEARAHLRLDDFDSAGGPDDPWLAVWISACSEAVLTWLKDPWRAFVPLLDTSGDPILDSSGDPEPSDVVRFQVKAAVMIELASQFRFREGEGDNAVPSHEGHGYTLTKGATAILNGLRRSTIA